MGENDNAPLWGGRFGTSPGDRLGRGGGPAGRRPGDGARRGGGRGVLVDARGRGRAHRGRAAVAGGRRRRGAEAPHGPPPPPPGGPRPAPVRLGGRGGDA